MASDWRSYLKVEMLQAKAASFHVLVNTFCRVVALLKPSDVESGTYNVTLVSFQL
ncbi:MAG: hypothetical protein QF470_05330 [Methylococcales bacterium]|jgi:hypothetical protein|nr:hypothetical protein [Methylococcales bacterium]